MAVRAQPGFYGKIPALGDFVSRRLPRQFVGPWDSWLQSAIAASREQLGAAWLDFYLTSPIWRFGVAAGLLGPTEWAGILMPSVDKVGRYYPLTLAAPVEHARRLPLLFDSARDWFTALERLALSALANHFELDRFDAALRDMTVPEIDWTRSATPESPGEDGRGKFAVHVSIGSPSDLSLAFAGLSAGVLDRYLPSHSLWYTEGSENIPPSLLVCEGLPPIDAYAALLAGHWAQRGWNLRSWAGPAVTHRVQPQPDCGGWEQVVSPPVQVENRLKWLSHGISHIGLRRKINEDAFLDQPEKGLWAVADGMGGHQAGDTASAAVVEVLKNIPQTSDLDRFMAQVRTALSDANRALWELAERRDRGETIGSTVVALLGGSDRAAVVWAGDSRLYRLRCGCLEQLTRDHSLFNEIVGSDGAPLDANLRGNVITRAVGADEILNLDVLEIDVREGDVFLLCSDGLDKEVDSPRIAEILSRGDCRTSAEALIAAALEAGARDNVTVVVVRCDAV